MYKIARQGQIIGEYEARSIQQLIDSGNLLVTDHAWASGMEGWKQLKELGFALPVLAAPSRSVPAPFIQIQPTGGPPPLPAELTVDEWRAMPEGPVPASCAKCASPDVRSFGILYQQGAHTSTSVGMTLSGQVGGMVTSGQTHLAAATQPPVRGSDGCCCPYLVWHADRPRIILHLGNGFPRRFPWRRYFNWCDLPRHS